ncbi:PAS domain S-box protein [Sphingobacterium sp. lm-10]|uniref:PAS domain S-box protein n=1 Tax=Sphingobacterium sp. lm-10 TaxID=2944904 RepID=UPI0020216539|nr:PAS domain S-box protein [Sphingobacterium sp. lm-10]MCL7987290.1 PAS domain S-box protein [Sphingobacterium sp. lm-10]
MNITLTGIVEVFFHLPHAVAIYDSKDLNIAFVNAQMLEIWNRKDNLVGRNFGDVFPEHVRQGFDALLRNVWLSGTTYTAKETPANILIDGELKTHYFDFEYRALQDNQGKTIAVLHTATEVSDRMLAWKTVLEREASEAAINEELRASNEELHSTMEELGETVQKLENSYDQIESSENQLRQIIQNASLGLGVIDVKTQNIQYANRHFLKLIHADEQAIGKRFIDVLSREKSELLSKLISKIVTNKEHFVRSEVETYFADDPNTYYHNVAYQPIFDKSGAVDCVLIAATEVTAQREAKAALELSYNQLRLAKISGGLGTFHLDVANDKLVWDERCKELFGVPVMKEVSYSSDFVNGLHPEDKTRVLSAIELAYEEGKSSGNFDIFYRTIGAMDSVIRHVHATGKVYFDSASRPINFIGTVRDRSAEVKMIEDLQNRDEQLQLVNEELATTNEELMAINEEYQVTNEMLLSSQYTTQNLIESLKVANDQIVENEERLNQAITSAKIGTWRLDVRSSKVHWDNRTKELYGFSLLDVVEFEHVLQHMHPSDRPRVEKAITRALSPELKEDYDITFRIIHENREEPTWIHAKGKAYFSEHDEPIYFSGIVLDITQAVAIKDKTDAFHKIVAQKERKLQLVLDSAKVGTYTFDLDTNEIQFNNHSQLLFGFTDNGKPKKSETLENVLGKYIPLLKNGIHEAINSGILYDESFQILNTKSGDTKWLRFVGNSAGYTDPSMFYGLIIDITAQKVDEKRKTDFLGIASHELRSPLTALTGYLQILQHKSASLSTDRIAAIVKSAEHQTYRMRTLIDGFLNISHIEDGNLRLNRTKFNMYGVLEELYGTFCDTIRSHKFVLDISNKSLEVFADREKVEQVIINFVNNAVKYTPSNTKVTLAADTDETALTIRVSDEGPGISDENQTRLFDKFFRIHGANSPLISGFGIGLYISREIMGLHGGEIGVSSTIGQGASFWISLPLTPID